MFFTYLIRMLLVFWIVSIVYRWVTQGSASKRRKPTVTDKKQSTAFRDVPYDTGKIEDADFEEIDEH